jgi:hypothetical protein
MTPHQTPAATALAAVEKRTPREWDGPNGGQCIVAADDPAGPRIVCAHGRRLIICSNIEPVNTFTALRPNPARRRRLHPGNAHAGAVPVGTLAPHHHTRLPHLAETLDPLPLSSPAREHLAALSHLPPLHAGVVPGHY